MTPSDLQTRAWHARDVAVEAAAEAARLIRYHAGRIADEAFEDKGTNDLVTDVDRRAQDLIRRKLRRAFPEAEFLAEEGAEEATPPAVAEGFRWIVDPIDGTTNFMHGLPPYAVSIALQHRAEIVAGVVFEVARGEVFTAVRGGGAYRNGRRLAVSQRRPLAEGLLSTGFPYRAFDHLDPYLDVFRAFLHAARGLRRPGAASETGLRAWDVAAGSLLVEEAGGRVSDFDDGDGFLVGRQILATNGHLHADMLRILIPLRTTTS